MDRITEVNATFHVVIAAQRRYGTVTGARADRVTQKPPAVHKDEVAVKLTVALPASVFDPLRPEVVVRIAGRDEVVVGVELQPPDQPEVEPLPDDTPGIVVGYDLRDTLSQRPTGAQTHDIEDGA